MKFRVVIFVFQLSELRQQFRHTTITGWATYDEVFGDHPNGKTTAEFDDPIIFNGKNIGISPAEFSEGPSKDPPNFMDSEHFRTAPARRSTATRIFFLGAFVPLRK
jgi:hypothetical protein